MGKQTYYHIIGKYFSWVVEKCQVDYFRKRGLKFKTKKVLMTETEFINLHD